jgi:acetyl-CoA synthetase
MFMKSGEEFVKKYDLSSIRILASVGEPLNPEAYMWFRKNIGSDQAPIMDTWWQTETGCHVVAPLAMTVSALSNPEAVSSIPQIN